ncbi:MAG: glutathione peroxidase [Ignavibacteriaceae bacterium]
MSKFTIKDINLKEVKLSKYKGKVLLIVNVASKCGFTSQYAGLQKIYEKYKDQGFEVLGFPCNDFGAQEPGTNEEIKNFCSLNYEVTFPMFDKVHVKGEEKVPLFELLTNNSVTGRSSINWNFEKFIIDKEGNVIDRFKTVTKPDSKKITSLIEKELSK